jgi:hypothetical protein
MYSSFLSNVWPHPFGGYSFLSAYSVPFPFRISLSLHPCILHEFPSLSSPRDGWGWVAWESDCKQSAVPAPDESWEKLTIWWNDKGGGTEELVESLLHSEEIISIQQNSNVYLNWHMWGVAFMVQHLLLLSACSCSCKYWAYRMTLQATVINLNKKKLHGLSPRANYNDRATAACRRSNCQLLRIEGATWSAWWIPTAVFSVF